MQFFQICKPLQDLLLLFCGEKPLIRQLLQPGLNTIQDLRPTLLSKPTLLYHPVNPSLDPPEDLRFILPTEVALQPHRDLLQDLRLILLGELTSLYHPVNSSFNLLQDFCPTLFS